MNKEAGNVRDQRIDAYITNAQPFAKPILEYIRSVVHKACNDCHETIKWSFPHFDYKGKMMCSMAAFKQHCALNFWLAAEMKTVQAHKEKTKAEAGNSMGHFGKITSVKDLPAEKELMGMIREAMELSEKGVVIKRSVPSKETELPVPDMLQKALIKNKNAKAAFEKFPPSHRREYITWIADAKTDTTRDKRIATAIEWIAEGKGRNWKYEKK